MYPSPFPLRIKRPWPPGLPTYNGMKDDGLGMNYPLAWLRGDSGSQGVQSLNFQGIGVSPWMHPRLDASMLGTETADVYQAMAVAALQDMRAIETSKQTVPSLVQFQQAQGGSSRSDSLLHNQMMHQSHSQPQYLQNLGENQSLAQTQSHLLQQQNSFNNQLQQQQQDHQQQQPQQHQHQHQQQHQHQNQQQQQHQQQPHIRPQQHLVDGHQVSGAVPLLSQFTAHTQSPSFQTISSMQQSFSDSSTNPVPNPVVSPLHGLLGSFPQDETSQLISFPRSSSLLTSSGWPPKRVAVDPILSSEARQGVMPSVEHSVCCFFAPIPWQDCSIEQNGSNDPQSHLLFGVNIDSTSLLQNGISSLREVGSDGDSTTIPFASFNCMSTAGPDYSPNTMVPNNCIEESSFLQSPDEAGQGNPSSRTFVKVYKSGSWSLDIEKFSSYQAGSLYLSLGVPLIT